MRKTKSLVNAGIEAVPNMFLADAGYCSKDNLEQISDAKVNAVIATGRIRHNERVPRHAERADPQRCDPAGADGTPAAYQGWAGRSFARRKAIVEPVFGQMKVRQHAGHLRLRGIAGAKGEWTLHVICHNLPKLANTANPAAAVAT